MRKLSLPLFLIVLALLFCGHRPVHAAPGDFLSQFPCSNPHAVAVSGSGELYVIDWDNHRIEVFAADGTFLRRWGGLGSGNGQFNFPLGIAIDGAGKVYVADTLNNRIQVFNADGSFVRKWGTLGTGNGQFNNPYGVAIDKGGNVYVTDYYNRRIQVFSATGTFLRKWGNPLPENVTSPYTPFGIAVDGAGKVYVVDNNNPRSIQIFAGNGTFLRTLDSRDGFFFPNYVAVDGGGNVYVSDSNQHIEVFAPDGSSKRVFGSFGTGNGEFQHQRGIAFDGKGKLYVADWRNNRIQAFESEALLRADAGPDQTARFGTWVTLDGSASVDPQGFPLSYQWRFASRPAGSTAVLRNAATAAPSFWADKFGTYTVELVVKNSLGSASLPDTALVNTALRIPKIKVTRQR